MLDERVGEGVRECVVAVESLAGTAVLHDDGDEELRKEGLATGPAGVGAACVRMEVETAAGAEVYLDDSGLE